MIFFFKFIIIIIIIVITTTTIIITLYYKHPDLEKIINRVISPALILIDDYDLKFKTRGVLLIDYLVKETTRLDVQV